MMHSLLAILICLPSFIFLIDFVQFVFTKKRLFGRHAIEIIEVFTIIGMPLFGLLFFDFDQKNDCCTESSLFSPEHRLTIYFWIAVVVVVYLISLSREVLFPPIVEVLVNSILVFGFVLNIFIAIHLSFIIVALIGNLPIGLILLIHLIKNQQRIILEANNDRFNHEAPIVRMAWRFLTMNVFSKFPLLLALAIPLVLLSSITLLLFGQKPDSIIQAFTQTYKHGFSQIDYQCDDVICGGHYLCTVAAKGHQTIVKPQRYGIRNGGIIVCNRQLLVSNAFEDLIAGASPKLHQLIRNKYDKVGDLVHRYYHFFEYKLVSDIVYIMMKPLEWMFILFLYSFVRSPENRIATQYLRPEDNANLLKKSL